MQQRVSLEKLLMTLTYLLNTSEYPDGSVDLLQMSLNNNSTHDYCQSQLQQLDEILDYVTVRNAEQTQRLEHINTELESIALQLSSPEILNQVISHSSNRYCENARGGITQLNINQNSYNFRCESNRYGENWLVIGAGLKRLGTPSIILNALESIGDFTDLRKNYFIGLRNLVALINDAPTELLCVWHDPVLRLEQYAWWPLFPAESLKSIENGQMKLVPPRISTQINNVLHIKNWKILLRTTTIAERNS